MIATLLITAALLQTPTATGVVSGVAVDSLTGRPLANVRITLARTDLIPPSSVRNPLPATRTPSDVFLPGEWWTQLADKSAVDAATAAGMTANDIRQILIRPDRAVAIALTDPVTTDGNGRFFFREVRPGTYRLVAGANGHAQSEYDGRAGAAPIVLAAGQSIDLQLPMLPAGVVSGRIKDLSGEPIPDITVQLIRFSYDAAGKKKIRVAASSRTNDRGEYRLFLIPPGRYYLQAGSTYGDFTPSSGDLAAQAANSVIQDHFVNTFYPGATDIDSAAVIEVKPGTEAERIDLSMSRLPGVRIRGRIITSRAAPSAWTEIYLSSGSTVGSSEGRAELATARSEHDPRNGSFEIEGVPPGSYVLTIRTEEPELGAVGPIVISNADKDLGEVRIGPPVSVIGRVRLDKEVPAGLALNKLKVLLTPASFDFQPFWIETNAEASPAADGALRINKVVLGDYQLSLANVPDGFYLKEARFGESDVLKGLLPVQSAVTESLEIVLGSDPGRIRGQASYGASRVAPGSQIVLAPDQRNRKDLFRNATADANGQFLFASVPPGDYKLFAWEALEPYSYFDPEVLRSVETRGVTVHVAPAATHTVTINPISVAP